MFDAKDEKEFYIEVKFIKYGTYTIHATSKEHAMEMYDRGEQENLVLKLNLYLLH